jgi:hypothetical protein
MPAARRLLVAFLVLIGAFLVLVGFAVASLYTVGQPILAAVVATAGLAGVGAGALTYWLVKKDEGAVEFDFEIQLPPPLVGKEEKTAEAATPAEVVRTPRMPRRPIKVQSMPVAELPKQYVDAVMRGAQARLSAMKAQSRSAHPGK